MHKCLVCNTVSSLISGEIGVCPECIRKNKGNAMSIAGKIQKWSRVTFNLPETPPKAASGIPCNLCVNECIIPKNERGYCGAIKNINGKLPKAKETKGYLSWYHEPLPTNCVADWVCAGGTGTGYPEYSHYAGAETGYKSLAAFFHTCTFNCLFCQNWHYKRETLKGKERTIHEFTADVDKKTSCICFFGGDPAPQLPFAIRASREALKKKNGKILRICWETNGSMVTELMDKMVELSLTSGGCLKFDLKTWDENLHIALTGVTNKKTKENFIRVGEKIKDRPVPPLLVASTLLIPGYIDEKEIKNISRFIASVNPEIPYNLLAFYPNFYMSDMPLTRRRFAENCLQIAKKEGLKNVIIGNTHMLV